MNNKKINNKKINNKKINNKKINKHNNNLNREKRIRRKSQVWYLEFMTAVFIFAIVLTIYYNYRTNVSLDEKNNINDMIVFAKTLSNSLMSSGIPSNWTNESYEVIGITDNNYRINETKLNWFKNIDSKDVRLSFQMTYNYHVYFENKNNQKINLNGTYFIGTNPSQNKSIVSVQRFVIYKHNLTKMIVQIYKSDWTNKLEHLLKYQNVERK